ncbi:hypothetical protein Tco_0095575, partial [Tanacetum coccineum]
MVSVEIRHGSVLIRHPNSAARDEEFEASSLSFDTKNEAYSWLTSNPVYNTNKSGNFSSRGNDKSRMPITTTTNTNTVGHRIYYHVTKDIQKSTTYPKMELTKTWRKIFIGIGGGEEMVFGSDS